MKLIIILSCLSFSIISHASIEPDKQAHFVVSAMISTSLTEILLEQGYKYNEAYFGAVITTMSIGFIKELCDREFDRQDLNYDLLGAITVPLLLIRF